MQTQYLTPIDDDYQTCERTKAVFRVHCADRSPRFITDLLEISPTRVVEAGVPAPRGEGKIGPIGKVNLWILDSEGSVESCDLRRHLDWILQQLEPASGRICDLRRDHIVMDISCVWWSKYGDGGPTLWPSQMSRIARLDLELSFSFAFYGGDPSLRG